MEQQKLYEIIALQSEITKKLKLVSKETDLCRYELHLKRLMDKKTADQAYRSLKELLFPDKDHLKMLYCQLECACRIYDRYREKQIPDHIYTDTMKCFARFLDECKKKNGRMFFDRGWWTYRQVSMNIFRIGALEYQFSRLEGENTIDIHIPSDADLSDASVDRSLKQAHDFFHTYFGAFAYHKYTCSSWLLSPVLVPFLPENSHILSFQRRFAITGENREDREYIEWLFQVPQDTGYEKLPAATCLQKRIRELLLHGGAVGCADGILKDIL